MRLMSLLIFLFVVTPFVEVALLLQVAAAIGGWRTFLLVVVTGVAGAFLARSQGFRVWTRIQQDLRTGKMPTDSLADGAMLLIAGAFLITPGILTDAFGFGLLVPAVRRVTRRMLANYFRGHVHVETSGDFVNPFSGGYQNGDVVDSYVVDSPQGDDREEEQGEHGPRPKLDSRDGTSEDDA